MWRSICGPNRKHVISERRKLRSKELHNMYSLPYITRVVKLWCMRWAGNVADTKAIKNTKIFVWGLTVTWYFGIHRRLWNDSNNSNKTGCGDGLQVQLLKTFCWDGSRNCSLPRWATVHTFIFPLPLQFPQFPHSVSLHHISVYSAFYFPLTLPFLGLFPKLLYSSVTISTCLSNFC